MEVKIKFEAYGTPDTVNGVCNNFCENYPEFSSNMEEEDYEYNKDTEKFMLLWVGKFDDELSEEDVEELLRLTHHAEGFYGETDAECVHVEVCVDGKWYGVAPD